MKERNPELLISNSKGKIYNLPDFAATGMKGGRFFRLKVEELVKLPPGSELFMLPDRAAVGYDFATQSFVTLDSYPVACFVSPGFTVSYNSAYKENKRHSLLPLFAYAAVAFYRDQFYVTACRVDWERRQDLRLMNINLVKKNVAGFKKIFSGNRLIRHLENCALVYGCPAAKNFFLHRHEAPLPTSPACNARCLGCLSLQPKNSCSATQARIKFVPTPAEVAEVALWHISNVADPVVSFGQGCEGEPLLNAALLEKTIRLIRKKTTKGMINLNTNASRPKSLARLFDAGLDSIRVSLNSARAKYYNRYFQPKGYLFKDVLSSIGIAKRKFRFVSVNYLTMPGFTDLADEFTAFKNFVETQHIDMIQWRSLNFDPLCYFRKLKTTLNNSRMLGVREVISTLKRDFPHVLMGYFNPSRSRINRHRKRHSR
ncbi:MAG: radical SAM protein [Candidatus Omnitrophica bacterium]|nr:radical SAM protein [Candidatus Omnitrophota bacterium]